MFSNFCSNTPISGVEHHLARCGIGSDQKKNNSTTTKSLQTDIFVLATNMYYALDMSGNMRYKLVIGDFVCTLQFSFSFRVKFFITAIFYIQSQIKS